MGYEIIIGLEVHVQLKTKSKMFCGCLTGFGARQNTQVCPVCLGLPGVLPVINKQSFEYALKAALALNCQIADFTKFDRKHYYYPDLPKNYQISQYDIPFSHDGYLGIQVDGKTKRVGITRVHLEEDAGKLIHPEEKESQYSLVDLNRTGMPLMEIVSEPDMNSPEEAHAYLTSLKEIMRYLGVSDCDMEKGTLRCDANLSLRPKVKKELGVKSEIKNLNSFKFVSKALAYEAKRQAELLEKGERIIQETRLWDEAKEVTRSMRSKEGAHDYRYFPEPDLEPIRIDEKWLADIRKTMPELPEARRSRLITQYGISNYEANVLTQEKIIIDYTEQALLKAKEQNVTLASVTNLTLGPVFKIINKQKIEFSEFTRKVPPENLVSLANELDKKTIVSTMSGVVLDEMFTSGKTARNIIKEKGLEQVSDKNALEPIIEEVIKNNQKIVADYKGGKKSAIMALVGQVMRASQGKANPQKVKELLTKHLG